MEWELTVHRDYKFLEVVTTGVADSAGSLKMAKSIAETMRKKN